jgi:hypothetical protein
VSAYDVPTGLLLLPEVLMLLDENDPECRMSETHLSVDFPRFDPMQTQGIAPELRTIASNNVVSYVDFVRNQKGLVAHSKSEINSRLDSEKWHRPYAEVLMETEPAKLTPLIAEAERAIFDRYLELRITTAAAEHSIDLENAVYYLSQLKKANRSAVPKS